MEIFLSLAKYISSNIGQSFIIFGGILGIITILTFAVNFTSTYDQKRFRFKDDLDKVGLVDYHINNLKKRPWWSWYRKWIEYILKSLDKYQYGEKNTWSEKFLINIEFAIIYTLAMILICWIFTGNGSIGSYILFNPITLWKRVVLLFIIIGYVFVYIKMRIFISQADMIKSILCFVALILSCQLLSLLGAGAVGVLIIVVGVGVGLAGVVAGAVVVVGVIAGGVVGVVGAVAVVVAIVTVAVVAAAVNNKKKY